MKNDSRTFFVLLAENNALEQMCVCWRWCSSYPNITRMKVIYYKTKMFNIFSRSVAHRMHNTEQVCLQIVMGSEWIPIKTAISFYQGSVLKRDPYSNMRSGVILGFWRTTVDSLWDAGTCVVFIWHRPFKNNIKRLRQGRKKEVMKKKMTKTPSVRSLCCTWMHFGLRFRVICVWYYAYALNMPL